MEPKKDIFDLFKDNQHKLNERPSQRAWERLEGRLDNHKDRNRTSIYRILSMAAAVVVLVAFVSLISVMFNADSQLFKNSMAEQVPVNQSVSNTFKTEELQVLTVSNENYKQIATYQKKYNQHLSSPIMEGKSNKKLIARMDPQRRDNNLNSFIAKAKRDKVQSMASSSVSSGLETQSLQSAPAIATYDEVESYAAESIKLPVYDSLVPTENPSADIVTSEPIDFADEDVIMAQKEEEVKDAETKSKKKTEQYAYDLAEEKAERSYEINKLSKARPAAAGASKALSVGIEQFKWLTGDWEGNVNNQVSVEKWKQIDNQTLEGRGFLMVDGLSTFNEKMKIQEVDGVINFIADLNGTGKPIYYELISNDGFQAIFENQNIEFPNQVVLQRTNSSNFSTIYQNTQPTNIGETQQNYYLNRNYIQKEQVIRNLRRVND